MASAGPSSDVGAPDGGRVAAAGASGLPSSPVDETALDKLVERALAAHKSGRFAFAAALWGRAVAAATQINPNTLAVIKCKLEHADSLSAQASATNSLAEKAALREESWALSFSVLPLLSSRTDANTLLPGRCTQTEVEFQKQFEVVKRQVLDEHPWSARDLQLLGFGVGYGAAMLAARHALSRCFRLSRPEASEMLPASRSFQGITFFKEVTFADTCSEALRICSADPFINALRERYTAPSMLAMRKERGLIDLDVASKVEKSVGVAATRRLADTAAHGLKTCFYPPCGKVESTVQQYKFCSACRSAWYCSAEHGALHWKEHKPIYRATVAAKQAAAAEDAAAAGGR